jgi:arylsulfatase A-like enzyme/Tfp pilus assembly protein PilF
MFRRKIRRRVKTKTSVSFTVREKARLIRISSFLKGASCLPALSLTISILCFMPQNARSQENGKSAGEISGLNVLLITIDTIRADRVGFYGYPIETPGMDFLAEEGACFMNALCQAPLTLPSHASIMTGTNPTFHQIKNNGTYYLKERFTTLAEVLQENGYRTAAFIGAFPLHAKFGLDQGFELYDDEFNNPAYLEGYELQRTAEHVCASASGWLEIHAGRKFFAWVHLYDPHLPYTPPPPFDEKYDDPYDGEIAYTDSQIVWIIELLKNKDLYENTLIIVVGDHGEGLGDHGEKDHGIFIYDTTMKVPFIMHGPGVIPAGIRIDDQVRTIDIFPTVLDFLKIRIPGDCRGTSLRPLLEGKNLELDAYGETYLPLLACGWSELKMLRTNEWKYIRAPKPELYHLESDADEKRNLINRESEVAARLEKRLSEIEDRENAPGTGEARKKSIPEDLRKKLISLGYIRGGAADSAQKSDIDPKDKIAVFEKIQQAEQALFLHDQPGEAEGILENLVKEEPDNHLVHNLLGLTFQKQERWEKSIDAIQRALRLKPDDSYAHYLLAVSYYKSGKKAPAVEHAEIVLSHFERHFDALLFLANIYKEHEEYDKGIRYLEKALEIEPGSEDLKLLYANYLLMLKEYGKARREYEKFIEMSPENPKAHHGLGLAHFFLGEYEKAIDCFTLEKNFRSNPDSNFFLGMAYGRLGKYQKAIDFLKKHLASLPAEKIEKRKRAEAAISYFQSKRERNNEM